MTQHTLTILPDEVTVSVEAGTPLVEALSRAGIHLTLPCGGEGRCGKCPVKILTNPPPPTESDRRFLGEAALADGLRLACGTSVTEAMTVHVPPGLRMDEAGEHCVDIKTHGINQRGEDTTPGFSTVVLPSREEKTTPVSRRLREEG